MSYSLRYITGHLLLFHYYSHTFYCLFFYQCIRKDYNSSYWEDKQNQVLVFEDDTMVLDLPAAGSPAKIVDGWKILPLTHPEVLHALLINDECTNIETSILLYYNRLLKSVSSNLSQVEASLLAPLSWSGQKVVNQSASPIK